MAIEKHDTTENTLVPVSEKYTLTKKMRRLAEDNRGRFSHQAATGRWKKL